MSKKTNNLINWRTPIKVTILAQQGQWLKIHPAISTANHDISHTDAYKALSFLWIKRSELEAGKCASFNVSIEEAEAGSVLFVTMDGSRGGIDW